MTNERIPTLTKKDVARRVAQLRGEPIYRAEPWVSATVDALRELMVEADPEVRIELRDFGVFEVKRTRAKPKARNPRTNETVFIPSRRKTHFKPSKLMKEALQRPLDELGYPAPDEEEAVGVAQTLSNGHAASGLAARRRPRGDG